MSGAIAALNPTSADYNLPTYPTFYSFASPHEIDWNGVGGAGYFAPSDTQDMTGPFGPVHHFPWAFAGYIDVPATTTNNCGGAIIGNCMSFAVGSDDGMMFAIGGFDPATNSATEQVFTNISGDRSFAYGGSPATVQVRFPAAGGLFPFALAFYENGGQYGLELAWANGLVATAPAAADTLNGFTEIPAANFYSPHVRATMTVADATTPTAVTLNDTLTYTVTIKNDGLIPATGLVYTMDTDSTKLIALASVPSAACDPTTTPSLGHRRIACSIGTLAAGASTTLTFAATVGALLPNSIIDTQGVVTGFATDSDVSAAILQGANQDLGEIYVVTNDPNKIAGSPDWPTLDNGNAPLSVSATAGNVDDDPTRVIYGVPAEAAPVLTSPTGATENDTNTHETFSGTCVPVEPAYDQVRVDVSPINAAQCPSGWTSNGTTCTCLVAPVVSGTSCTFTCPGQAALLDGGYTATTSIVDAGGTQGVTRSFPFSVTAPPAPVVDAPVSGAHEVSSSVVFSGTSTAAPGSQIKVSVAGTTTGTCVASVTSSNTFACQVSGLAVGSYNFSAAVIEASGGLGAAATGTFTVDSLTGVVPAPTLNAVPSPTKNTATTITGTAQSSDTITVTADGVTLCTISAAANTCGGAATCPFSCAAPAPGGWSEGAHSVFAVANNGTTNSADSNVVSFVIDTTAPAAPTIDTIPPQENASDFPLTIHGTGETGDTVQATVQTTSGTVVATCSPAPTVVSGNWSCPALASLPDGNYKVVATQTDPAGNVSAATTSAAFTVDTTAPTKPTIVVSPQRINAATGSVSVSGTSDPSESLLEVIDSTNRVLCTTAASTTAAHITLAGNGNWSCSLAPSALPDGEFDLRARSTDAAGNSALSDPFTVDKDTLAPNPPVLDNVTQFASPTQPIFTGVAEPGSSVNVLSGATVVCTTIADANGHFVCPIASAVSGPYPRTVSYDATATDSFGNVSQVSNTISVKIDPSQPPAPALTTIDDRSTSSGTVDTPNHLSLYAGNGVGGDTITVSVDGTAVCSIVVQSNGTWACPDTATAIASGSHTVTAVQSRSGTPPVTGPATAPITLIVDDHVPAAPVITLSTPASPSGIANPTISGTGEAGDVVTLVNQANDILCTTTVNSSGNWSCAVSEPDGNYLLRARQTSAAQITSAFSTPFPLTIDTTGAPIIKSPSAATKNKRPPIGGTAPSAAPGDTVNVYIAGSTTPLCTATINSDHNWECTPTSDLPEGQVTVQAQTQGPSGSLSPMSASFVLTTDYTPPALTASLGKDNPPVLSGTSEPGATVTVTANGEPLCTTVVAADGTWTCSAESALPNGTYTLVATATDAAGNATSVTLPQRLIIGSGGTSSGSSSGSSGGAPPANNNRLSGAGFGCRATGSNAMTGWGLMMMAMAWRGLRRRRSMARHSLARRFAPSRAAVVLVAAALMVLMQARPASAQFAVNRFEPSERGSEWFVLDSLDFRGQTRPAVGLVGDYAYRPLVSYNSSGHFQRALVNDQLYLHLGASMVFWSRLRLALDLPFVPFNDGKDTTIGTTTYKAPTKFSLGDAGVAADVRIVGEHGGPFQLAAGAKLFVPTGSRSQYTGDGVAHVLFRANIAGDIALFTYAAQIGFHFRPNSDALAGEPTGSEIMAGGAAGLRLGPVVLGPEVYASTVTANPKGLFKVSTATSFEGLFGLHWQFVRDWRAGIGAGPGFSRGYGTPVVRGVASIEWAPAFQKPEPPPEPVPEPVVVAPPPPPPPDRDGDGILDANDACPDLAGIGDPDPKKNGCPPDKDLDGIPDAEDRCPDVPGVKEFQGCPADTDGDGILDKDDACPAVAGIATGDPKTHGCPAPIGDKDNDGIKDDKDACPTEPGIADPNPKKNGCPQVVLVGGEIKILQQVQFASGSAKILPDSFPLLRAVANVLSMHSDLKQVRIEGHTDNKGTPDKNMVLSQQRAESVRDWLVAGGVDASRLQAQGYGQSKPIMPNATDKGRKVNRRVEFHIVDAPAPQPALEAPK